MKSFSIEWMSGIGDRNFFATMLVFRLGILLYSRVLRRFSRGVLRWWPKKSGEPLTRLAAQQLQILLYQGSPIGAQLAEDWRSLTV